ncbi:MAG: CBS domain-containing protein [Candidatus Omnitrophica bacterium]|jgi:CBS domain-containing protein|nr:CBS domain-containing protein [Candidatus Omnitrophota bacterium]MDD5080919.1 CBS domain-containing protein [Candidatus Omnitrophota bacterium]
MKKIRAFKMMLSRGVVVSDEEATGTDLARLMDQHNIGAVVILKGDKVIGLVSERDIVRRINAKGLSPDNIKAKDFMTKKVVTAEFKDGLDKIYKKLCSVDFRHLPIVDKGRLVGIASQRDVLYSLLSVDR